MVHNTGTFLLNSVMLQATIETLVFVHFASFASRSFSHYPMFNMPKRKVKTFKFSSSQSDWLKQFASRYMTIEDNDPDGHSGDLTRFVQETYAELTQKYNFGDSREKDIIIKVSRSIGHT